MYGETYHFHADVMSKRPYLRMEWCIRVIENPVRREVQPDGRIRFWAFVEELAEVHPNLRGRALRVVTLEYGVTILTAFPDRRFRSEESSAN